jgi:hypothetical protein
VQEVGGVISISVSIKRPLSKVFMLDSCLFCRLVATYQHVAVVSFAENGRFLRQESSDNLPFLGTGKKWVYDFWLL